MKQRARAGPGLRGPGEGSVGQGLVWGAGGLGFPCHRGKVQGEQTHPGCVGHLLLLLDGKCGCGEPPRAPSAFPASWRDPEGRPRGSVRPGAQGPGTRGLPGTGGAPAAVAAPGESVSPAGAVGGERGARPPQRPEAGGGERRVGPLFGHPPHPGSCGSPPRPALFACLSERDFLIALHWLQVGSWAGTEPRTAGQISCKPLIDFHPPTFPPPPLPPPPGCPGSLPARHM